MFNTEQPLLISMKCWSQLLRVNFIKTWPFDDSNFLSPSHLNGAALACRVLVRLPWFWWMLFFFFFFGWLSTSSMQHGLLNPNMFQMCLTSWVSLTSVRTAQSRAYWTCLTYREVSLLKRTSEKSPDGNVFLLNRHDWGCELLRNNLFMSDCAQRRFL